MNKQLQTLLLAKEKHYLTQEKYFKKYQQPIMTVNLNIPGLNKQKLSYQFFFKNNVKPKLFTFLQTNNFNYQILTEKNDHAGNFLILTLNKNINCQDLKKMLIIEEKKHFGWEIVDIDLYDQTNHKITRKEINEPARKCFICFKSAKLCAKTKQHDINELLHYIDNLIMANKKSV